MKQKLAKVIQKVIYLICLTLWSACSGDQPTQQTNDGLSEVNLKQSPQPAHLAFARWTDTLPTIKLPQAIDYPATEWGKIEMNGPRATDDAEIKGLIATNFKQYHYAKDSLVAFVKQADLQHALVYPIGKVKYHHAQQVTILLLFLQTTTPALSQKHYVLSYHHRKTGQPLGYDLLAGMVRSPRQHRQYYGRWGIQKHQVWINRFCFKNPDSGLRQAQKYKVIFNQTTKPQSRPRAQPERLYALSGTSKEVQGIRYRRHCDEKVGYCVSLPYEVFTYSARTAELGISEDFVSGDQQATLLFYRDVSNEATFRNSEGQFDQKRYFNISKKTMAEDGHQLTYTYYHQNYFVLSGIRRDGRIFYEKHCGATHFALVYPAAQKAKYDKIVTQISKHFRVK